VYSGAPLRDLDGGENIAPKPIFNNDGRSNSRV
jgi:hypothetical protein